MKHLLFTLTLLLFTITACNAGDPPFCTADKIAIEKLKQENAQLVQNLTQLQFHMAEQTSAASKAEEKRLRDSLPTPSAEKK